MSIYLVLGVSGMEEIGRCVVTLYNCNTRGATRWFMRPHLLNWFSMFARARARSNWYKRSRNELIAPVIKPGVSGTCTAIETNQFSNPSKNNSKKHSVRVFNSYFQSNRNVWYTRIKSKKSFINWLLIHSFTSFRSRDIQKLSC